MLAIGTEPLKLADGTLINPDNGEVIPVQEAGMTEVPNYQDIQRDFTDRRKRISDIPVPIKEMNAISVVISYTIFGLPNEDIAEVLGISVEYIENMKLSDGYKELMEGFITNIAETDGDHVRSLFSQQSILAARTITGMLNSASPHVAMSAAKDVLDRAGHRPADVVEHNHKMEGGLVIRHVRRSEDEEITIDLTPDGDSV